ncbi:gliding motility lipoprotein GldH [Leyella stercorea]|uniref:gliding motility lipoprotein GldH n=1 Tax=Leyella stercorea TaxID=363265 RepID=UPI001F277872|nr:gliding motility lipoprotein GldH [Leyella stercorea]
MNNSKCIALLAAMLLLVLSACNRKLVYDRYLSTPISGWEKNDTLSYDIRPVSGTDTYDMWLGLRTSEAYPFTAITLIVEQHIYPKDTIVNDTVNCKLTDRHGNASGTGVNFHQYRFPVTELQLQDGDSIHIRVRHDMKREILPGISDVGISLRCK